MVAFSCMNREAVLQFIRCDPALSSLSNRLRSELGDDPAHDWHHSIRVATATVELLRAESRSPTLAATLEREAITAALLHDLVNLPKNSPERSRASLMAAQKARPILVEMGFSATSIDRIAGAIEDHSFSSGRIPRTDLGNALQDADRLEALGSIGLFRLIATGVRLGGVFFDNDDPWAMTRELDDHRFSVDHCFTKLLKLPATFRTQAGKREALKRAKTIVMVLAALGEELGTPVPGERLGSIEDSF